MKRIKRMLVLAFATMAVCTCMTACKPYDAPEFVRIEPHQTAFLIPLVGDTSNQASFESEEMLAEAKVASKEVEIPHRWVQTGRFSGEGEYRPTMALIVVDRSPVTREWSASADSGTDSSNQAIHAESIESVGFSVGMNCSAQIASEQDAVLFLYSYNNKPLSAVMDEEIRPIVESEFIKQCGAYSLAGIRTNKGEIMNAVSDIVIPMFKEKGITITVLGLKDTITYDDPDIQNAINEQFSSEARLEVQENENQRILSEAEAKAQASLIEAEAQAEANKKIAESLTPDLVEKIKYDKWDGKVPVVSGGNSIIDVGEIG